MPHHPRIDPLQRQRIQERALRQGPKWNQARAWLPIIDDHLLEAAADLPCPHATDALVLDDGTNSLSARLHGRAEHVVSARLGGDIPFRPQGYDLIISLPFLHSQDEPVAALSLLRAMLRPGGFALVAAYAQGSLENFRACFQEAELALTGGLSPRFHPLPSAAGLAQWGQEAGFPSVVATQERLSWPCHHVTDLAHSLRAIGATNCLADRPRQPAPRRLFDRAQSLYAQGDYPPHISINLTVLVLGTGI
ncbi:MAG: hypothetical protein IPI58_09055 [Alphaproteobacteria bacterium]|nr:MAG: hypothetical protein IPI58_09055 [Alphaproteobacteria bacterium]